MGLPTNHRQQNKIAAYISSIHPTKTMWTASQVGWFDEANFVLPDTTIGKDEDSPVGYAVRTLSMNARYLVELLTLFGTHSVPYFI